MYAAFDAERQWEYYSTKRHWDYERWRRRRDADDCSAIKKEVARYLKEVRSRQQHEAHLQEVEVLVEEVVEELIPALAADVLSSGLRSSSSQRRRIQNRSFARGERSFSRPLP